ncbi:MAG: S-layer homology domain-containing protein [Bacillota bacterium]|nr:S-layer homology domain-containing protein [Bacillota bacterium]
MKILIVLSAIFLFSTTAYADMKFSDVPENSTFSESVMRMAALGIICGTDDGSYNPKSYVTREQFVKFALLAAGYLNTAENTTGASGFKDIVLSRWSNGYIKTALEKGIISVPADGKFRPEETITLKDACSIIVKLLNGNAKSGLYEEAQHLGIVNGISLKQNDKLPKWAAALMLDRMWIIKAQNNTFSNIENTFPIQKSLCTEAIVLGNCLTSRNIGVNQVLTDKGTFNLLAFGKTLELGNRYLFIFCGNTAVLASDKQETVLNISVDSAVETNITYRDGYLLKNIALPENIEYYYQGAKISYEDMKKLVERSTSVVLAYNEEKSGFKYGAIFAPVHTKAVFVKNSSDLVSQKAGPVNFSDNPAVLRNGMVTDYNHIQSGDIVYGVSDIWNNNRYVLDSNKKAGGKITAILPNKLCPQIIQIDNKDYDICSDIDFSQVNSFSSYFNINDNIIVSLGYDGRIVNIDSILQNVNIDYAFVLDSSNEMKRDDSGVLNTFHYAKLLLSNGATAVYKVNTDATVSKGRLVRYRYIDNQTLSLEQLSYSSTPTTYLTKGDWKLGSMDVSNDVRIFNITSDDINDLQVSLIDWNSMPDGEIPNGKILYTNVSGDFGEVNIILTRDILNELYKSAVIKDISLDRVNPDGTQSYSYTLLVAGSQYKYTGNIVGAIKGMVVLTKMTASDIKSIVSLESPIASGNRIQAVSSKKIKLNNTIYRLSDNVSVYYKDSSNNIYTLSLSELTANKVYGSVYLYSGYDSSINGKADIVLISEL